MDVQEVADILLAQGKRVSVAEADTAGLVGYLMCSIPGSSQYFPGGVIAYTGGLKQSILGVSDELYDTKGSVSREMAIAMAKGVRELTDTDYGVSTTRRSPALPGGAPVCPSVPSSSACRSRTARTRRWKFE